MTSENQMTNENERLINGLMIHPDRREEFTTKILAKVVDSSKQNHCEGLIKKIIKLSDQIINEDSIDLGKTKRGQIADSLIKKAINSLLQRMTNRSKTLVTK